MYICIFATIVAEQIPVFITYPSDMWAQIIIKYEFLHEMHPLLLVLI